MHVNYFTSLDESLYAEWKALWLQESSATFSNSPGWLRSLMEIQPSEKVLIVTVSEGGKLVGVLPLIQNTRFMISCYSLLPADFVYGSPFLLAGRDPKIFSVMYQYVLRDKTVVFDNVALDCVHIVQSSTQDYALVPFGKNYQMDILVESDGKACIPNRKKLLYKGRKFMEHFSLRTYTGSDKKALELIFSIDAMTSKQKKGINAFAQPETRQLYQALGKHFADNMVLHVLYLDEVPCAYEIGFRVGNTYCGSQLAFVAEFAKVSPGKVLVIALIDVLAQAGITRLDFGSGESSIKTTLATMEQPFYKLVLTRNRLHKAILCTAYAGREMVFEFLNKHARLYSTYRHIKGFAS